MKAKFLLAIALLVSLSMVSCVVALTSSANSSQVPSNAIGTQASATVGPVTYWVDSGSGVQKHNLGSSDTIYIGAFNYLFIQFKGKCTGNADTQKGDMSVADNDNNIVTDGILITPGGWHTLKTNPPLRWTSPGTYHIQLNVASPGGGWDSRVITIIVSP